MTALEKFQDKLGGVAGALQSNIYVSAITKGMLGSMGVLIGGSILNLLVNLPIPGWTDLLTKIGLYGLLSTVVTIYQLTAIIMCFTIAYALAKSKGVDQLQAGVISMMCFMISLPVAATADGSNAFVLTNLSAQAISSAIVVSLIATTIFSWVIKKGWVIKMPESVPEFVRASFAVIPSAMLTVIPFIILRGVFALTPFGSLPGFINGIIAMPLQAVGNTLAGHMILLFFSSLLWWFGIHNMPVVMTAYIVTYPALVENITAVMAGQAAPNMLNWSTWLIPGQFIGGPGCLFGLYIAMLLFCKSDRYKAQARLQALPGAFNITEPASFGIPIVLNVRLLIPYIIVPQIIEVLLYLALKTGIVGTAVVDMNTFLPAPIVGFLLGGGISLGIFMLLAIAISTVLYIPFVKSMDNDAVKEEAAAAAAK